MEIMKGENEKTTLFKVSGIILKNSPFTSCSKVTEEASTKNKFAIINPKRKKAAPTGEFQDKTAVMSEIADVGAAFGENHLQYCGLLADVVAYVPCY